MRFSTKAIRVGQDPEAAARAVIVPIYQTSTYAFESIGRHRGYEYTRSGNPTRTALERCLASLEEADHGLAFSSGSAATDAALSILRPGDHVVAAKHIYGGTFRILESIYKPMGVAVSYFDPEDMDSLARALTPRTKMIWTETPANPLLQITDIAVAAEISRSIGAILVVDNTFSSPFFQKPLLFGADVVVHSTTKYINGHSDVVGGAIATRNPELHAAFQFRQNALGAVPSPFDCWLTLRGLKTLAVRMKQHEVNARAVAEFLLNHALVEQVNYPGLPQHPQHEIAKRQMTGFGAMITFRIKGGLEHVARFVESVRVFLFAESLGGVESLICHPQTMSHASLTEEERQAIGIIPTTIRLSIGIEDELDLVEDLDRALAASREFNCVSSRPEEKPPVEESRSAARQVAP